MAGTTWAGDHERMERNGFTPGRIVCGVDDSEKADRVAAVAARLATDLEVPVTLVRVIDPVPTLALGFRRPILRRARAVRRDLATLADAHGFPPGTRTHVTTGQVSGALEALAREEDARLLVVGGPADGVLTAIAPGGVAGGLVKSSPCPVVIVPEGAVRPREAGFIPAVVCGVAGDELDRKVLRLASDLASRLGARLHAVHAFNPLLLGVTGVAVPSVPVELDLRDEAERVLRNALEEAEVAATQHVVDLPPDVALRRVAGEEGAGLIVAAGRDRSRFGRLVHGSVPMRLAAESSTSLVVVPEAAQLEPGTGHYEVATAV
jgi:nucleotide-binding universal stress UspA family protein